MSTDVFECEKCQNVDNIHSTPQTSIGYECHRCKYGEWHGFFEEAKYDYYRHGPALNKQPPGGSDDGFPSFS